MSKILHFILTLILIISLSLLSNSNRKNVKYRFIIQLITIEIIIAYVFLNLEIGLNFIEKLSKLFHKLLLCAAEGTNFVFGNMNEQGLAFFFLNILCPIIFMSALIGILKYIKILFYIIKIIGTILSKINGMGKLESFNAISSLILGQTENFITYKDTINKISEHQIYTMAITAMATVSMPVVGAYMNIISPKYVITALILNIFSTFIILSVLNPYKTINEKEIEILICSEQKNLFEIISEYILTGFNIAINISAMLIGFIALIATINALFNKLIGISFQSILGYIFFPIAWIIGIPIHEIIPAGKIMATKLVFNEFIAMQELQKTTDELSPHSVAILSVFLVSFANLSSIGIIIGAIKSLNTKQGNKISKYGLKIIYNATLINLLSASVTGLII